MNKLVLLALTATFSLTTFAETPAQSEGYASESSAPRLSTQELYARFEKCTRANIAINKIVSPSDVRAGLRKYTDALLKNGVFGRLNPGITAPMGFKVLDFTKDGIYAGVEQMIPNARMREDFIFTVTLPSWLREIGSGKRNPEELVPNLHKTATRKVTDENEIRAALKLHDQILLKDYDHFDHRLEDPKIVLNEEDRVALMDSVCECKKYPSSEGQSWINRIEKFKHDLIEHAIKLEVQGKIRPINEGDLECSRHSV